MADYSSDVRWKVMRFENGPRAIEVADHHRRNPASVNTPEGFAFVREWPLYENAPSKEADEDGTS